MSNVFRNILTLTLICVGLFPLQAEADQRISYCDFVIQFPKDSDVLGQEGKDEIARAMPEVRMIAHPVAVFGLVIPKDAVKDGKPVGIANRRVNNIEKALAELANINKFDVRIWFSGDSDQISQNFMQIYLCEDIKSR